MKKTRRFTEMVVGAAIVTFAVACEAPQSPQLEATDDGAVSTTAPSSVGFVDPGYVTGRDGALGASAAPPPAGAIFRMYRDNVAWFGDNRDNATLLSIGLTLGTDYFIHPLSALSGGIPGGTTVAHMSSNGFGAASASANQRSPAAQASLASFLNTGGVVIVDMGDNEGGNGFVAPGSSGTPSLVFPSPAQNSTLAPAALGPDGLLGTADDHPLVKGPDGVAGTGDDLNNSNIDACCFVAHGNLEQGITLPAGATVLATARFGGVERTVLAEYCHNGGRVILDTYTKELFIWSPVGFGTPTRFMTNLFTYALSPAASCVIPVDIDIKPGSDPNSINTRSKGVIAVAILTTASFDAADVAPGTVTLGDDDGNDTPVATRKNGSLRANLGDVDDDGDLDMILHFDTQALVANGDLTTGTTELILNGENLAGTPIKGSDAVRVVR